VPASLLYNGVRFPCDGPDLLNVERIDLGCVPMVTTMMNRGMQVDLSHFARMEKTLTEDMDRITAEVHQLTGVWVNLGSGDQVSNLLFKILGLKQAKPKMTKSGDRESVEYEVLVAVQHQHEVVPKILDYKELEKLRGTYVVPMPKLARRTNHGVWRMFPNLGQTRVPSGRFNCKEPNLLAFPTRTKRGREIRNGFITDEGWCYLSVDFSQFEPRACAHCSEDPDLIWIFESEQDIYSDFAIAAFQLDDQRYQEPDGKWYYPGVDKDEHRFPSKTCWLAAIYDVTAMGLQEQMPVVCATCHKPTSSDKDLPLHDCNNFRPLWVEDACQGILNSLYLKYPGILRDRKRHHARARRYGYIWGEWGRLHHVAAVRSVHPWVVAAALRETGNFPYQELNSGALKLAMAAIHDDLDGLTGDVCWPLLPIHDELVWETREDVAEELGELCKMRFETCVPLKVPVKAEYKTNEPTWGRVK
jgi:DNA polymerase-1